LSYALYLWHYPLFSKVAGLRLGVLARPVMFVAAFVAAVLSYILIEQPCLRLKSKLSARPAARSALAPSTEPVMATHTVTK
jgi:peptidoglycan/LPS O-acetylase OafA/YrhL